jgi:hypothetical protein
MNKDAVIALLQDYRRRGVVKAGNLLLIPAAEALAFADALAAQEIVILGVNGWYYDRPPSGPQDVDAISQDLWFDFWVEVDFLKHNRAQLTPQIAFVSYAFEFPAEWIAEALAWPLD